MTLMVIIRYYNHQKNFIDFADGIVPFLAYVCRMRGPRKDMVSDVSRSYRSCPLPLLKLRSSVVETLTPSWETTTAASLDAAS